MCKPHKMNGCNPDKIGESSKYGGTQGAKLKIYTDDDIKSINLVVEE